MHFPAARELVGYMVKLKEVCRHIRSKNAGPFWVTIDLFFDGEEQYGRYRNSDVLAAETFAALYDTDPTFVKRFSIDRLSTIKISFVRPSAQGGVVERDMHSGQQYVRLLELELD
jgi:Domain of unknown function (DUF4387)